jgi:hypothetical protein
VNVASGFGRSSRWSKKGGSLAHLHLLALEVLEVVIGDGRDGAATTGSAATGTHRIEVPAVEVTALVVGRVVVGAVVFVSCRQLPHSYNCARLRSRKLGESAHWTLAGRYSVTVFNLYHANVETLFLDYWDAAL